MPNGASTFVLYLPPPENNLIPFPLPIHIPLSGLISIAEVELRSLREVSIVILLFPRIKISAEPISIFDGRISTLEIPLSLLLIAFCIVLYASCVLEKLIAELTKLIPPVV